MMETLIFMWCPAQLVLVGWVEGQRSGGITLRLVKIIGL